MRRLPLYTDLREEVERTPPASINPSCAACSLCEDARTVCIPPEGDVVGDVLLVVGNFPTRHADAVGVPFTDDSGMALRGEIAQRWPGPVVYTYAIRCPAATLKKVTEPMVNACRGYLAGVVQEVKPVRILAMGSVAYAGLTGRRISPENIRRGYTHLSDRTPVFPLIAMGTAAKNRFLYEHLMEDLDYALTADPPTAPWGEVYRLIETGEDAEEAVARLSEFSSVSYDVEHSGPTHTEFFAMDTLAMAPTEIPHEVYVWDEVALDKPECVAPLRRIIADAKIEKVGHGVKVDITAVQLDPRIATEVAGPIGDTLIWRKLDDPDVLGRLAYQSEMVGMGGHKSEMEQALKDANKTIEKTREEYDADHLDLPGVLPRALEGAVHYKGLDPETCSYGLVASSMRSKYCALDVVSTGRIAQRIRPRISRRPNLARTWETLLSQASTTVSHIERWGFPADRRQIANVGRFVDGELASLLPKLESHGVDFKMSQDQAMVRFLYDKLGMPVLGETDGGNPSVAAPVLEKLRGRHPVIDLILAYKEYETIGSRYAWGLMDHVRADGRIHCRYNIDGTVTGRFSSSDPNMQNIPSRNPTLSKMVKNIFVARPGWRLVQLDYSQLEYRVASLLSGDQVMQQVFRDGDDLHQRTAEMVSMDAWGIPSDIIKTYTKDQMKPYRTDAKRVNFGVLYGLGATTLAKDLGVSVNKARRFIAMIMGRFPDLAEWIEDQIRFAKRHGYVFTYFDGKPGRWRPLWGIADPDDGVKSGARNAAINTPVQGSSAEYMLRSLNEVVSWIVEDAIPAEVVGTVHDSLMLHVQEDWAEEVTETAVDIMEGWWSGTVPLVADGDHGAKWGTMEEMTRDPHGKLQWAA